MNMNGQPATTHPTNNNEQLIGKFHVVNVDKLPANPVNVHDEIATTVGQPPSSSTASDESAGPSRFQMIRVDRNFLRGRWKVNDYEPPENTSTAPNPPVNNAIENEPVNSTTIPNIPTNASTITTMPSTVPPIVHADSNVTSSATLAATAASAAAAAATAFQHQRLAMNNPATVLPAPNVPPPAGLLPGFPPAALANMAAAQNQPYMLPGHPQFGYYQFFLPPYAPYAAQWATLAATNSYMPPPPMPPHQQQASQLPTGNLGDPIRLTDTMLDGNSENPVIPSNLFSNPTADSLQNAALAASTAHYLYAANAAQHPHSTYVSQAPLTNASPYTTGVPYPNAGAAPPPLSQAPPIIPSTTRPTAFAQVIPNNATDVQQQIQSHQVPTTQTQQPPLSQPQQHAPILTSPKQEAPSTKSQIQQPTVPKPIPAQVRPVTVISNATNTDTVKPTATTNSTYVADLLSTSPAIANAQQPSRSLMSPITIQTGNSNHMPSPNKATTNVLTDIWSYTAGGPSLNLSQTAAQTAAVTAAAAMGLLNNENSQNTEIANEILKELTTPTKQNNTTDIDNKISAAMDLVKMHLLSAVRDEVTELRQQIRTLTEKMNSVEHENAFLRQHVPNEVYAQYTPLLLGVSSANESLNVTTTVTTTASTGSTSSAVSSQSIPTAFVSSAPPLGQQPLLSTTSQSQLVPSQPPPPHSSTNLPST